MKVNNKNIKRRLVVILMIGIILMTNILNSTVKVQASTGKWIDLGGSWEFRIDGPHTGPDTGK